MRFDRNNLRKVLRSPLLAVGAIASVFVPRGPERWVCASGIGYGEGAVALAHAARADGLRVTWLCRTEAGLVAARNAGFPASLNSGIAGWWTTLRAGTVVVTHGLGDANPYALRGARIVQLWHGVPLKHLHRDAGVTYSLPRFPGSRWAERMLRAGSERAYTRITHFVAASAESGRRLTSAFGLRPDQLLVTGDPRDDVLLQGEQDAKREDARAHLEHVLGARLEETVVLFAPTWRDGEPDPVVPTQAEWGMLERLAAELKLSIIIRPHPLAVGAYREGMGQRSALHMLEVTLQPDITPVLPAVDVLITDYSSIAYDFSLLGRPMLYLAPDLEAYAASRGFYEAIEVFCGGLPARSWSGVAEQLRSLAAVPSETLDASIRHAKETAQRVHDFHDGRNTERVMARLMAGEKHRRAPAGS